MDSYIWYMCVIYSKTLGGINFKSNNEKVKIESGSQREF